MQYKYPHTIENGAGEQLTFTRKVVDETGEWLEVENLVQPGDGPPMHVHFKQAESLTVIKGRIGIQRPDKDAEFFGEGATVTFEAGEPHRFFNAGKEPLICKGWVKPALNTEYFLTEIYRSTRESGGKQPSQFDAAWLLTKYRSEFDMLVIPAFVKKVIFPVVITIGKLAGKHRKFENAPPAIK